MESLAPGSDADHSSWYELEARRATREYDRLEEMLDDIWRAHEHGWLPLSMTEKRRPLSQRLRPWEWLSRKSVYVVAYRHASR